MDLFLKYIKEKRVKKLLITIGLIIVMGNSYAGVNDTLKLFSEEEKVSVEQKITELENKRKLHIHVNTLSLEEGFSVEDPEKVIILNIKKEENSKGKIELNFSRDIDVEDYQEDINLILSNAEGTLSKGEIGKYSIEVLEGIDGVLDKIKIEEPIVVEEEVTKNEKFNIFGGIAIAFFVIFGIIIRVLSIQKKRRELKEKNK
jgi:hypothetical protein